MIVFVALYQCAVMAHHAAHIPLVIHDVVVQVAE